MNLEQKRRSVTNFTGFSNVNLMPTKTTQPGVFVPANAASLLASMDDNYMDSPLSAASSSMFLQEEYERFSLGPAEDTPYSCQVCGRGFTKLVSLKSHETVHKGEKTHTCTYCPKTFARRHDMLRHERTVHSAQKSLSCVTCQKSFDGTEQLLEHCTETNHALPEKKPKVPRKKSMKKLPGIKKPSGLADSFDFQQPQMDVDQWLDAGVTPDPTFAQIDNLNPSSYINPMGMLRTNQMPIYPHPGQTLAQPVLDPTYLPYQDPNFINPNMNIGNNNFPLQNGLPQTGFQPDFGVGDYQMTVNAPGLQPHLQKGADLYPLDIPLATQKYQSVPQEFLQFEMNGKPVASNSDLRTGLFDDVFENLVDGLVIQERSDGDESMYPILHGPFLHPF